MTLVVNVHYFTFTIFGVSEASDSKSGSSMTNESICWATGASGSVSESSALGEFPFFLPWCRAGCSAVGVKVREMGAVVWPLDSGALDATFGFVMWITGLKRDHTKHLFTFKKYFSQMFRGDYVSQAFMVQLLQRNHNSGKPTRKKFSA